MKKILIIILSLTLTGNVMLAQDNSVAVPPVSVANKQYMQITTIESVVAGGLGRSRMIVTHADGNQKESNLENLFSVAGINFKNIKENESNILTTLKQYTDAGWKLDHTTSLTLSPGETGGNGIFMTRYLLSKPDEKKAF